jgi:hypothetical protein
MSDPTSYTASIRPASLIRPGQLRVERRLKAGDAYEFVAVDFPPPILGGNQLWVDAVNGNDSTGTPGQAEKPFLTITAALAAAVSGDTVIIRSGVYEESITLKNGVDLHCYAGVTLQKTYAVGTTGQYHIRDNGVAVSCSILGRPDIIGTGPLAAGSCFSFVLTGASNVTIECGRSSLTGGVNGVANFKTDHVGAELNLDCKVLINDAYDGVWQHEGRVICHIDYADVEDNLFEISTNNSTTRNYYYVGLAEATGTSAILAGGGGAGFEAIIEGNFRGKGFAAEVANGSGRFILRNCLIDSRSDSTVSPIEIPYPDIVEVIVENSTLLAHASANSISGSAAIHLENVAVNRPIDSGMTVTGNYFQNGYPVATIPTYANDAAADADTALPVGALYRTTAGARTVYRKP